MNILQAIDEKLKFEKFNIEGNKQIIDASTSESENNISENHSIYLMKKQIILNINNLVNYFNEISVILRDSSGKILKDEVTLNDMIAKNKVIQNKCEMIGDQINFEKKVIEQIYKRITNIMNDQKYKDLVQKFKEKYSIIQECKSLKITADGKLLNLNQNLQKPQEQIEEIIKKLELFNPINGRITDIKSENNNFYDKISQMIDQGNSLKDYIYLVQDQQQQHEDYLNNAYQPILEISNREVSQDPELLNVKQDLQKILSQIEHSQADFNQKSNQIDFLFQTVRDFFDKEIEKRFKEGQNQLELLDKELNESGDLHNIAKKRLKHFRDLLQNSQQKQGANDIQLMDKLSELQLEGNQIEELIVELEPKIQDQKKKKTEFKKLIDEMGRNFQKFKPAQIDNLLESLEDLKEKSSSISDRLKQNEQQIDEKIKSVGELVQTFESKQNTQEQIKQTEFELNDDLKYLEELLEKIQSSLPGIKQAVQEMIENSINADDDYFVKKQEINEQDEELNEIEEVLSVFKKNHKDFSQQKVSLNGQKEKTKNIDQLQKIHEQMLELKENLGNLMNDCIDTQEQINDLKRDIGDCDIPILIANRKQDYEKFSKRFDRIQKELQNLLKAQKKPEDIILQQLKQAEFKLKIIDKERSDILKIIKLELESLVPKDFEDYTKNFNIIKTLKKIKFQIIQSEAKLKEIEDIQDEILKKFSEQDIENSTELLSLKSQDLLDRLIKSQKQLKRIKKSSEQMDGNISNNEEEQFVQALNNEMPDVLSNLEQSLLSFKDIEKLLQEVKQTSNIQKMQELQKKVNLALENVQESETLVAKLEKELIEQNHLKKLNKRDMELQELEKLLFEFIDDLKLERQNTDIELDRNHEKQDENRGQKMVDKDGKEVDIMQDLISLESQMQLYILDIDKQLNELRNMNNQREKILEDFDQQVPKMVLSERKRRNESVVADENPLKQKKSNPQQKQKTSRTKEQDENISKEIQPDIYKMIEINSLFRNKIKNLLKDTKAFKKQRKELEEKYSNLRKEVFKIKQIQLYRPVAGDVVDEVFSGILNKAKLSIEVQRISGGNYMFGTKKILAKIVNGRLVIRVGGGYMNAEEFIEQYGKIEMMKILKMEEQKEKEEKGGFDIIGEQRRIPRATQSPSKIKQNIIIGADIKEKMRQTLLSIKPYDRQVTNKDSLSSTFSNRNKLELTPTRAGLQKKEINDSTPRENAKKFFQKLVKQSSNVQQHQNDQ